MKILNVLFILLLASLLSACGSSSERRLQEQEEYLGTGGPIGRLYHSTIYYPNEIALRHDGYLIGIEKLNRVLGPKDEIEGKLKANSAAGLRTDEDSLKFVGDGMFMFVTHILKNYSDVRVPNCAIYNGYDFLLPEPRTTKKSEGVPFVAPCPEVQKATPVAYSRNFENSWAAMDSLGESITKRLDVGNYSHVVVIVMGWNTVQEEAVRNFNSLATQLTRAMKEKGTAFSPLVIGVTWPSQWNSPWLDPLYKLLSFDTKRGDADEVGATWLGVLLHKTLPQAMPKNNPPKVVVIGHSFGARATAVATCVGPLIVRSTGESPAYAESIDHLINLQGAFPAERLFPEKNTGFRLPTDCPSSKYFALTASVHDEAIRRPYWISPYIGDARIYTKHCDTQSTAVNCARADADGNLIGYRAAERPSRITYIDANPLIMENAYSSGGGAHSDIYRFEHGRLISRIIDSGR